VNNSGYPRFNAWLLTLILLVGGAWLTYWAVSRLMGGREGVRWSLFVLLGGLTAYNYLALGLPGARDWTAAQGVFGVLVLTFCGELVGVFAAALRRRRTNVSKSQEG
jgi:predicted permease